MSWIKNDITDHKDWAEMRFFFFFSIHVVRSDWNTFNVHFIPGDSAHCNKPHAEQ